MVSLNNCPLTWVILHEAEAGLVTCRRLLSSSPSLPGRPCHARGRQHQMDSSKNCEDASAHFEKVAQKRNKRILSLTTVSAAHTFSGMRLKPLARHIFGTVLAIALIASSLSEAYAAATYCMCNQSMAATADGAYVQDCSMAKTTSHNRQPCKGTSSNCLRCVGCATQITLFGNGEFASLLRLSTRVAAASGIAPPGLTTRPALPPPISNS
jgi:hypothetical protein